MHSDIANIISRIENVETTNIPPTLIYNEGWMLRLVLEWFSKNPNIEHPLSFDDNSKWYSEALLPSPFLYSPKGAKLAEGYTHADGVVGKFKIGTDSNKGELSLYPTCDFFYVVEAKMESPLSKSTSNAPNYNQAARYVACIADLLVKAKLTNTSPKKLAFFVLMPETNTHITDTIIKLKQDNLIQTIQMRINQYANYHLDHKYETLNWLKDNLEDFVRNKIEIKLITWEELVNFINEPELSAFYDNCKIYNQ